MVILDGEEFLTVEEAAALLGVKRETLYAYVSRGVLKSYRQGIKRQRLYRRAEVAALIRLDRGGGPVIPRPRTGSATEARPRYASAATIFRACFMWSMACSRHDTIAYAFQSRSSTQCSGCTRPWARRHSPP